MTECDSNSSIKGTDESDNVWTNVGAHLKQVLFGHSLEDLVLPCLSHVAIDQKLIQDEVCLCRHTNLMNLTSN